MFILGVTFFGVAGMFPGMLAGLGLLPGVLTQWRAEHPDVTTDYIHIDAAMIFMVTDPARFDVIVTDNLFGDIITDLAAAITGGIGLAASGNVNPDRTAPSMFEPVHGSAPDIAGQQKADPTAAILSAALLLEHLGHRDPGTRPPHALGFVAHVRLVVERPPLDVPAVVGAEGQPPDPIEPDRCERGAAGELANPHRDVDGGGGDAHPSILPDHDERDPAIDPGGVVGSLSMQFPRSW